MDVSSGTRGVAAGVVAVLALAGCLGGPGSGTGPAPRPDTATVIVRYVWKVGPGTPRCTAHLAWSFTPLALTGTTGSGAAVVRTHDYDVSPGASGTCVFEVGEPGLTTGRWRMDLQPSGQSCELQLTGGANSYVVRHGESGCAPGFG